MKALAAFVAIFVAVMGLFYADRAEGDSVSGQQQS
jgi:hypothetical protein